MSLLTIRHTLLNFIILLLAGQYLHAQNPIFILEGRIEYEKKVNIWARLERDDSWSELTKKTTPQFKTTYFNLSFKGNKTLYKPGRENPDNKPGFWDLPVAEDNVIYSDIDNSGSVSQKHVFEQLFLIQDSVRRIKWKLTSETRTIAGFNCRRANAMIMDSIYVVAFYTDEIVSSGGPESFSGLPGMIMGIALPHEHITWFATKVQAVKISDAELASPVKGQKVSNASLLSLLSDRLKDWGKYGRIYIQAIML